MKLGRLLQVVGSVVATVVILEVMVREGFPLWMEGRMLISLFASYTVPTVPGKVHVLVQRLVREAQDPVKEPVITADCSMRGKEEWKDRVGFLPEPLLVGLLARRTLPLSPPGPRLSLRAPCSAACAKPLSYW